MHQMYVSNYHLDVTMLECVINPVITNHDLTCIVVK